MKILVIDNGTKHLGRLKHLLYGNDIIIYPLFRKYPNSSLFDLTILSGGSQFSIIDAPEIFEEEIGLIKKSLKPLIGICEGCEMIAYTFGSKLEFYQQKSKGLRKIEPIADNQIFKDLGNMKVYEAHHWAITELGKYLIGLAKSRTGYEIIKHNARDIYGFQFHPEMLDDESVGDELFRRVIRKVK